MNPSKQFEKKFELVPTDDPGKVGFKVALNNEFFSPSDIPAFASAYSAWTYRNSLRSAWDAYVFVRTEEDQGETWFHFIPSLPSSVKTTQRIDEIWGAVTVYEYLQNTTSVSLPDIASDTSAYAPINTAGYVLDAKEEPIAKGLSRFIVETVAANAVVFPTSRFDEESGIVVEGSKSYALVATNPGTTQVNVNGEYTVSNKLSHNLYVQEQGVVTGLPKEESAALTWDTQDKIYWPPVLVDYAFKVVVKPAGILCNKLLHAHIREGYSGNVNVTRQLWWQPTPYTVPTAESMIPARIEIDGNLESPVLRETLHGEFVYTEENYVSPLAQWLPAVGEEGHKLVTWTFSPTNYEDWPATIVVFTQEYYRGGYRCLRETYSRPDNYNASTTTVTERNWIETDGDFYGPRNYI